jgi:phosphomannomutase
MHRLRDRPPATLLGARLKVDDLLPDADVLRWRWTGDPDGRVVVRPSGTEPKLKAYLEVVQPDGDANRAAAALAALRAEVEALLQSG